GNVVSNFRHVNFCGDSGNGHCMIVDEFHLVFPHRPLCLLIARKVNFQGDEHSKNLLLVDFHHPANGIANWWCVLFRCLNVLLSTQQQSGALRSPQSLPSGEADKVESHLRELPEVFSWRYVCRTVDERWYVVFFGN